MIESFFWSVPHIQNYLIEMLPGMLPALVLYGLTVPVRKRKLMRSGLHSSAGREITLLLFIMYLAGLAALTLFPREFWSALRQGEPIAPLYPSWEEIFTETDYRNLFEPLQEIRRAIRRGSRWLWLMLLSNILMFVPLGLCSALLWRNGRWWKSLLLGASGSILIETVQFFIGRSTDIDDVILNTGGTLLGFWLYCLLRAVFPRGILKFQCFTDGSVQKWTN